MTYATVPLDQLGHGIGTAATVLRANAMAAGLDAPVPTCPDWTVRDLVAHLGMVHRWAASCLKGHPAPFGDTEAILAEGHASPDILGWFDTGATALLQAIVDAADDLETLVFLRDAGPPKYFWARRQCHETTIHAVDAMAARLGRLPTRPETVWIDEETALDGIDELLTGFVTRKGQRVHTPAPTDWLVAADGADRAWYVHTEPDAPASTERLEIQLDSDVDAAVSGPAVEVYLTLWNRARLGEESDFLTWWRATTKVTWS